MKKEDCKCHDGSLPVRILLQRDAARQMRVKHLPNQVRKQQV